MPSAARSTASSPGYTEPAWNDSGRTLITPITATGEPGPTVTPATSAVESRAIQPCQWGLGRSGCLGERLGPEDAGDLLGVERLALQKGSGQRVKLLDVLLEDLLGPRGAVHDDPLDLAVDGQRGLLAVVLGPRHFPAEEDVLLVLAEGERSQAIGHAPLAHHLAGHLGRLLEVVAGAGRLLLQDDLF